MIEIKTQKQLENIVNRVITNETIMIYPLSEDLPYQLYSDLNIGSNTSILGLGKTKINRNLPANEVKPCAINVQGAENVYIKGLYITTSDGGLQTDGIVINRSGSSYSSGLSTGDSSRYDNSTVGYQSVSKLGVTIEECVFENCRIATSIEESHNCQIVDNKYISSKSNSIYMYNSRGNIISDNVIEKNSQSSILLSYSNNNIIVNNFITESSIAIALEYSAYNLISKNNIRDNTESYCINLYDSSFNTISSNIISDSNSIGINLNAKSGNNCISNNSLNNNARVGIDLYSSNNSVSNNVITSTGNNEQGLRVAGSKNAIFSNQITENSIGITINGSYIMVYANVCLGNTSGNIINNGSTNIISTSYNLY